MFNTRLLALIRKEFIQMTRDPRTLVIALILPIMQLVLLGYTANNDVRNIPLAVFDQDHGQAARELLDAYRAADYFRVAYEVNSESELRDLIDSNRARAGLIIPPDYTTKVKGNGTAQVAFVLDGSDATSASTSLPAAQLIAQQHSTEILQQRLAARGQSAPLQQPVELRTQVWFNPDLRSAYFFIPGLFGVILFTLTSSLTASAIVRERESGTIEQLIVTPIRSWELMVGKVLPYVLLAIANMLEVLIVGALWFKVPIRGSLLLITFASGLFLLTGLGLGLLASTVAKTQQQAQLMVQATLLPVLFLSGYIFPLQAMPQVLQWISYLIPMRYFLIVIRSLLVKGSSAVDLQTELIALAVFAVALMTLAAVRFRKRLD